MFASRRATSRLGGDGGNPTRAPSNSRIETDGWYIDFEYDSAARPEAVAHTPGVRSAPLPGRGPHAHRRHGEARLPVHVTTTVQGTAAGPPR